MAAAKKRTLGVISDEILAVQKRIKQLNDDVDALEAKKKALGGELILAAQAVDLDKGGGRVSTFKVEPHTSPHVADWDAFYEYIYEKKYLHLLQRRPGVLACAELWEKGVEIPGVEKFTQNKVTVKEA